MYQSTTSFPGYYTTCENSAHRKATPVPPLEATSLPSSPLSPPITTPSSRGSAFSAASASKAQHDMGWLANFGRTSVSRDKERKATSSSHSSSTGWGAPHLGTAFTDGQAYSPDMANQYFTLAGDDGLTRKTAEKRDGRPGPMQRIMHRTNNLYPLPCDDQEQQVSRTTSFSAGALR